MSAAVELLTADITVLSDYENPKRAGHGAAAAVFELARRGEAELAVAPQGYREDVKGDYIRRLGGVREREGVSEMRQLSYPSEHTYPGPDLFPGAHVEGFGAAWQQVAASWPSHERRPPGSGDRWHVETHLHEGRSVFLTSDEPLLEMCRRLREEHGYPIVAVTPADYLERRAATDVPPARDRIAGLDWWHTIEVAPGVVTPGGWDLRPTAARIPWPRSLEGLRCLDIGTMDGFWAFELERRGAREIVATDLRASSAADPFPGDRGRGRPLGNTFRVAAELLGSDVEYRHLNVYDLDPADVGQFDLVFMGYVLQMLSDPLRGLRAVRGVCRGSLIVLDTVSAPLSLVPAPVARLDARRDGSEWFVFNPRGLRQALRLAGFAVEATTSILRDNAGLRNSELPLGGRLLHAAGIRGRSVAVRARPHPVNTR